MKKLCSVCRYGRTHVFIKTMSVIPYKVKTTKEYNCLISGDVMTEDEIPDECINFDDNGWRYEKLGIKRYKLSHRTTDN